MIIIIIIIIRVTIIMIYAFIFHHKVAQLQRWQQLQTSEDTIEPSCLSDTLNFEAYAWLNLTQMMWHTESQTLAMWVTCSCPVHIMLTVEPIGWATFKLCTYAGLQYQHDNAKKNSNEDSKRTSRFTSTRIKISKVTIGIRRCKISKVLVIFCGQLFSVMILSKHIK